MCRATQRSLLVANRFRRTLGVDRKYLQLPGYWNRNRPITDGLIASLISKLTVDVNGFAVGPERLDYFFGDRDFEILHDSELALKHRDFFLDGVQVQCLGLGI